MRFVPHSVSLTELASTKLAKVFGESKARELCLEAMQNVGAEAIDTPDALKRVAEDLIARGGAVTLIGHSLRMEALLRGATKG
jgi:hypothetical protein